MHTPCWLVIMPFILWFAFAFCNRADNPPPHIVKTSMERVGLPVLFLLMV